MTSDNDRFALAVEAAERVLEDGCTDLLFAPDDVEEARIAVQRLAQGFEEGPRQLRMARDASRRSGTLLSRDRLQGLAEIVQNSDDTEASEVLFMLRPAEFLATHNGHPVRLEHVLALATPWLTTKTDDAEAIGRFGIGISALHSLSPTLEVHCAPFHVRIGDPTVAPMDPPELPPSFCEPGWTTIRIPLTAGALEPRMLETWLDGWDDSSLLFLRHVVRVTLLAPDGDTIRELALKRRREEDPKSALENQTMPCEFATTSDRRSWALYSTEVLTPDGIEREQKVTGPTTPIAVAIPLSPTERGQIYAGLPVAPTRWPLFANAQLDPIASRADFADTPWNRAVIDLVAEFWADAVLDLFARDPMAAWQAIPLPKGHQGESESPVIQAFEDAVVEQARQTVASRLSFLLPEQGHVSLAQLAVEAQHLEGVLNDAEIAQLAELSATLPVSLRDPDGRWRLVLDDWRSHGADLPEEVSVEQALDLVGKEERPVHLTIELVAAGLQEDLGAKLLKLPCLVAHDGKRLVPPARDSTRAVSAEISPLAEELGVTTLLHSAYSTKTNGAPEVLAWLEKCRALLDVSDDAEVLRRLARYGRSGSTISSPLADEQVRALRDAFEHIDRDEGEKLGPDVGRAIRLMSYTYDTEGHKITSAALPADAYLPRAIDRDPGSFAIAADKTQGLIWLSDHYARALRSREGQGGMGALRFLRMLGAETAPRLRPHIELERRYQNDRRKGLARTKHGPEARNLALEQRDASYTLEDHDSPDLLAVIGDIALEQQGEQRRTRTSSLLSALGRAWEDRLSDLAEVETAQADYGWKVKGRIRSFWLAQAGEVVWLDDESGMAREPVELSLRTTGTEAIYGSSSSNYLHKELDQPIRHQVLTALGVSSEPSRSELVERLQELKRFSSENEVPPEELRNSAVLVYRALTRGLDKAENDSDLTTRQLQIEFSRNQLLFTNLGWRSPQSVRTGPPIFGNLHAFAPPIKECEPLWDELGLRQPSLDDCLEILKQVAANCKDAPDASEETILLETLRTLAQRYIPGHRVKSGELAELVLWTSMGWTQDRPVYATDDPILVAGLGDRLPIWQPGGVIEQFRPLLEPLHLTEIRTSEAIVIAPELAQEDPKQTALFQRAIELLHDDLQRNDDKLAQGLMVPWDSLAMYVVRVHPSLTLQLDMPSGQKYDCEVNAKIDTACATVFVSETAALTRVDGGGRALAALFEGDVRLVAQAWRAACDMAEEGIKARRIELAHERAEREEAELSDDSRLKELREQTTQKYDSSRKSGGRPAADNAHPSKTAIHEPEPKKQPPPAAAPRILVNPQSLSVINPEGRIEHATPGAGSGTGGGSSRGGGLQEPRGGTNGPSNRSPLREYSEIDKENVGFEIFAKALSSDQNKITDLRSQRGVGADAVDEQGRFYELKVYADSEPDEISLTDAEVKRAHTTPDFYLAVISNVEGADAQPVVRIVDNPLKKLRPTNRGTITLSGVRDATSLVYEFTSTNNQQATDEKG